MKDEIGTLNLLTSEVVAEAGKEIKTGISVCLSWSLENIREPGFYYAWPTRIASRTTIVTRYLFTCRLRRYMEKLETQRWKLILRSVLIMSAKLSEWLHDLAKDIQSRARISLGLEVHRAIPCI